jgi:predicted DNA-binding transcriptional regulator YafY
VSGIFFDQGKTMRADRLISILLLLQDRGRMTARQLAGELEVSERTIYRDIEALSTAGVPVYAEHGPGGGLALIDSYRTNLTGLNEGELHALFMALSIPGPLDRLGVSRELKSALQKLSAALPEAQRASEETAHRRFHLDWSWWFHSQEPVPHLSTVRQAVWEERRLHLRYLTYLLYPTELEVEPYGLVAKAGIWYLVAGVDGRARVYRVAWLVDAGLLEDHFTRPPDFDLAGFWQGWCEEYEAQQHGYPVTLRISPGLLKLLPLYFGQRFVEQLSKAGPPDEQDWVSIRLSFESLEAARDRVLSMGGAVEVIEPEALRMTVLDYAAQIVDLYRHRV